MFDSPLFCLRALDTKLIDRKNGNGRFLFMKNHIPLLTAFAVAVASLSTSSAANIISFNAVGATSGGMGNTETAGASGAVGSNWNNMNSAQTTGGGAIAGSLAAGVIKDDNGTILTTTAISWAGTGVALAGGNGTGSQKMFESEWDLFDSASNTAIADMTLSLTNVPYATYDVYFYVQDANDTNTRGGNVTANGITKSITMYNAPANNPAGNFGYTEADNAFTWDAANTTRGSYLRIQNVTGSTLTLDLSSKNPSTPRLRFSGFQVVQVPEPSSAALILLGLGSAFLLRRRPRA